MCLALNGKQGVATLAAGGGGRALPSGDAAGAEVGLLRRLGGDAAPLSTDTCAAAWALLQLERHAGVVPASSVPTSLSAGSSGGPTATSAPPSALAPSILMCSPGALLVDLVPCGTLRRPVRRRCWWLVRRMLCTDPSLGAPCQHPMCCTLCTQCVAPNVLHPMHSMCCTLCVAPNVLHHPMCCTQCVAPVAPNVLHHPMCCTQRVAPPNVLHPIRRK